MMRQIFIRGKIRTEDLDSVLPLLDAVIAVSSESSISLKYCKKDNAEFKLYKAGEISSLSPKFGKKLRLKISCNSAVLQDVYPRIKRYLIKDTSHLA